MKRHPGDDGKSGHEAAAEDDGDQRKPRHEGHFEDALAIGLGAAQDDHAERDQHEGEERADVGEIGGIRRGHEPGRNPDGETRNPRGPVRSLELGMNFGEELGEEAVAGHGVPDARLAILKYQQRRDHARESADDDDGARPAAGAEHLEGKGNRGFCGFARNKTGVPHHAQQNQGDAYVEHSAHNQGSDDADGQIALGIARFLGGGGDGIEADVGKEDDSAAGNDAAEPGGRERMPVAGIDQCAADDQENENGADLDGDHDVVGLGGFADTAHEEHGENQNDEEGGNVEVGARPVAGFPNRRGPSIRQIYTEGSELRLCVSAEADGDHHVADYILEDQVPADNPGENFAECRVGIRVGAARDGNHRGQFGVAQAGEAAGHGDQK